MKNQIGLKQEHADQLNDKLNDLLCNLHIYYQNLRGFHWNIKGPDFFELHEKYEELYTRAVESIDEVAERILTLGGQPVHAYSDFLKRSGIKEKKNMSGSEETVKAVITDLQKIIEKERAVLGVAEKADDEGTADLMSGYLKGQEKDIWMLNAFTAKG